MGGKFVVRAGKHSILEGEAVSVDIPSLPLHNDAVQFNRQFVFKDDDGKPMVNKPYTIWNKSGQTYNGVTDSEGKTTVVLTTASDDLMARLTPTPEIQK